MLIPVSATHALSTKTLSFTAEVWADNWFALYINGKKVGEDSVPITTVRSFNKEKIVFSASYPLTVALIAKDYTEDVSGLEYIGTEKQQIGDAGIIAQITESKSGNFVTATSTNWKVLIINKAPLNPTCVNSKSPKSECKYSDTKIPSTWYSKTYPDSNWARATSFSEAEVGVKDGYNEIKWDARAKLIWSSDLKLDNTILLRTTAKTSASSIASTNSKFLLTSPDFADGGKLPITNTCDGSSLLPTLAWSTGVAGVKSYALIMETIPGPPRPGETESGNHIYFILYNIDAKTNALSAMTKNVGTFGKNTVTGKFDYTPPCSQGPGTKLYTITAYALSTTIDLPQSSANQVGLISAINGKVLATAALNASYERKTS